MMTVSSRASASRRCAARTGSHAAHRRPVIWCHDEIVLEVREEDAERAAALEQAMTLAFEQIFPGAPLNNLVSVHAGRNWGETK